MGTTMKFEFPKKSVSKRRRIFQNRAKVILEPLIKSAMVDIEHDGDQSSVDITNAVIRDILTEVAESEELFFPGKIYRDDDEFFEVLKREVFGR